MAKECKYILWLIILAFDILLSQALEIRGSVRDSSTYEPLPYANISVPGTNVGTTTDRTGRFHLVVADTIREVVVSCVGYAGRQIGIGFGDNPVIIMLSPIAYMLQEVNVYSRRSALEGHDLTLSQLRSGEFEKIAGITKDPLRVVQTLPGISANNEATAEFNVRGGTSDENLVIVNGIRVLAPYHLKEDPLSSLGVFNIDMTRSIDLSVGAFSAQFGDALSSIMRINYRTAERSRFAGQVSLSMIDANVLVEGPMTSKGGVMISVRKSYLEHMLRLLGGSSNVHPSFYDLQAQCDYDFAPSSRILLNAIHSSDDFRYDPSTRVTKQWSLWRINGENVNVSETKNEFREDKFGYSTTLLGLKSTNILSTRAFHEGMLSYYEETNREDQIYKTTQFGEFQNRPQYFSKRVWDGDFLEASSTKVIEFRNDIQYQPLAFATMKAGAFLQGIRYSTEREFSAPAILITNVSFYPDTTTIEDPPDPAYNDTTVIDARTHKYGGYLEMDLQLSDRFVVSAGIRGDYFDMNRQSVLSPRVRASIVLLPSTTLRFGWGVAYQFPSYRQLRYEIPTRDNTKAQKAIHYVAGIEHRFNMGPTVKIEGFVKEYSSLIPVQRSGNGRLAYGQRRNTAVGTSSGLDASIAYNAGPLHLWISYGLLEAKERSAEERYFFRITDQRHTASIVLSTNLFGNWDISLRGYYGSGYAYTPFIATYDSARNVRLWSAGPGNTDHYPSYQRVDVRVGKEFELFGNPLSVFIDIMNTFGRRNVFSYSYSYSLDGTPERKEKVLLPLVPSLGITYSF